MLRVPPPQRDQFSALLLSDLKAVNEKCLTMVGDVVESGSENMVGALVGGWG